MMLDQYFTPEHVADALVAGAPPASRPSVCVDASCGTGNLLRAVERRFPEAACVGMDVDRSTILRTRRRHPEWVLSVGDVFSEQSTAALRVGQGCDYLVANPPFSMRHERGRTVEYGGESVRCSVAMAHILRAIELFTPKAGLLVLVPESLMFSQLDESARGHLERTFRLKVLERMSNTTFSGATVNSLIVEVRRGAKRAGTLPQTAVLGGCDLIRGGLPVHEAVPSRHGAPFIHSTAIGPLADRSSQATYLPRVKPLSRGLVAGNVILLPRVGMPVRESIRRVWLGQTVQLSDCVIALHFPNAAVASAAASAIRKNYDVLVHAYHGTGARYTTVRHLTHILGPLSSLWSDR